MWQGIADEHQYMSKSPKDDFGNDSAVHHYAHIDLWWGHVTHTEHIFYSLLILFYYILFNSNGQIFN